MDTKRYRQRLKMLFSDIEQIAASTLGKTPPVRAELDALRARLLELEAEFLESEKRQPARAETPSVEAPAAVSSPATLYERDQVGFAYAGDKLEPVEGSVQTLTQLDHALKALLTASGEEIGELQIEQPSDRPLDPEEMNLAQNVAQQASLQIQNLRLLAATERARAEAESATRQFIHEGWESYLDAIHQHERVGFAYDKDALTPFTNKLPANSGYEVPLDVMEEQIGALYLKADPDHPLTDDERELIAAVARQISQQVENLRLLSDASRARAEAEDLTRRMTRESWQEFAAEQEEEKPLGFVYDSNQVVPTEDPAGIEEADLTQPLLVNGETIGQLVIAGADKLPPEAASLAASIAAQASIHLETLRLNDELRKRAAELQELDRLKSAFLANMSHELRTPLNSILGFADVMLEELDGPLTENMSNDLRLIQKNGQHLLHLINDVLDMAKITAGRMNLSPERFKVQEIFDEVVNITSPLAGEKKLTLTIEKNSDKNVEIYADRTRLRQVMINVINNAIKFTEKGKIRIRVDRRDENALIVVRDTGVGIPPSELETIFQEFVQVDSSTTRKAGGTGLGLPISRKLVEMHGGRMWAESTGVAGEGTTLFVELPLEAKLTEPAEKQQK
ncbi:MAG TPA: ATP-binding protein [Anaerolineales bacterium]|nr:ATP-binding protein [Anaerolineales bacterium]